VSVRVGVNGLGRIGRALVRVAHTRPELGVEVVAANDLAEAGALARLLSHDTVHGPFPGRVAADDGGLELDGRRIAVSRAERLEAIDWAKDGVELVVEATGKFRSRAAAAGHLIRGAAAHDAGAETREGHRGVQRVVVSATIPDADATFCVGVNERSFDPERHRVVSNASCTTNCLAAVLAVLHPRFGVRRAMMNTVHCVTNSQNLVDMAHADPRRARAAIANLIPTTSDAIPSIDWVMPELAGRIEGLAVRVPIVAGSLIDLVVDLERGAPRDALADAFRAAEAGPLAGILGTTDEELVSSDFVNDPRSAIVDLPLLQSSGDHLVRVVAWYDNEWGYANRLAELLAHLSASAG
jgi:glyceraldehyde 3-phosphate dehydrogenase